MTEHKPDLSPSAWHFEEKVKYNQRKMWKAMFLKMKKIHNF